METMRRRSEEAAAASVHHASLSQQYLLLSQKFATLADQSIDPQFANDLSLVHAAQAIADTLDRESHTGVSQTAFPFPLRREPRNSPEPARQRQALAQPINSPQPQPQYNRSHATGTATAGATRPGSGAIELRSTVPDSSPLTSTATTNTPDPAQAAAQVSDPPDAMQPAAVTQPQQTRTRKIAESRGGTKSRTGTQGEARSSRKVQRRGKKADVRQVAARAQLQPTSTTPVEITGADERLIPQQRTVVEEIRRNRGSLLMSTGILTFAVVVMGMIHFEIELPWSCFRSWRDLPMNRRWWNPPFRFRLQLRTR